MSPPPMALLAALLAAPAGPGTEARPIAVLGEMMRAVNAGDAAAYARLYAPEAVIDIAGGDALRGRAAIEEYEASLLREFPGTRLQFYDAWLSGPTAVVHYGVNGRTPGGQAMGHEGLLFYRFDASGLIAEERRYLDSLTPMAQLGALGGRPARSLPALPASMRTHLSRDSPEETARVSVVKAALAAVEAGDETAFASAVADDAVVDEMIEREPCRGRAAATQWLRRWTSAIPDGRIEITTILGAGDWVLTEAVVRGTLEGPLGPLAATKAAFTVHRALAVEVRAGKISRLLAFMNGKELAQATGQWPLPAPR